MFTCDECKKTYKREVYLKKHIDGKKCSKKNSKNKISYERDFEKKYNEDTEYKKRCNNKLGINTTNTLLKKVSACELSRYWIKNSDSKNNKTSKTDFILCDLSNNKNYRLSLKKNIGRNTSCGRDEFVKLIDSILGYPKYKDNKELLKICNELKDNFPNMIEGEGKLKTQKENQYNRLKKMYANLEDEKNTDKEYLWYKKVSKMLKNCNRIWKMLREEYEDFVYDIMSETITGKNKFGNNIGIVDHIVIVNNNLEIINHIDIENNKDEFKKYIKNTTPKNAFATKSASKGEYRHIWTRFC